MERFHPHPNPPPQSRGRGQNRSPGTIRHDLISYRPAPHGITVMPTTRPPGPLLARVNRVLAARPDDPDGCDARLLARFRDHRDPDAFAGLVARHGPLVAAVCRRVAGDPHLADDAFQATFLVLAR